ncbi:hypothetical protein [Laceyella putida]|uniref:Uncharacterized protein n=1 Tax=Laceyella putida TaxID=110101 RepID=A0ABW2RNH1_9BACL
MAEICFWYDREKARLVVRHCASGEKRVIHKLQRMTWFLHTYGMTLEEVARPRYGEDRLHLFKRMQVLDQSEGSKEE